MRINYVYESLCYVIIDMHLHVHVYMLMCLNEYDYVFISLYSCVHVFLSTHLYFLKLIMTCSIK